MRTLFLTSMWHKGSGTEASPSMIFLLDLLIVKSFKHELLTQSTPRELKLQHFWLVLYRATLFLFSANIPYHHLRAALQQTLGLTCY